MAINCGMIERLLFFAKRDGNFVAFFASFSFGCNVVVVVRVNEGCLQKVSFFLIVNVLSEKTVSQTDRLFKNRFLVDNVAAQFQKITLCELFLKYCQRCDENIWRNFARL